MGIGYYIVISILKHNVNKFIGLLISTDSEPLKSEDGSGYKIKISQMDFNNYQQACIDGKEIYIDINGNPQIRDKIKDK